MAEGTDPPIPLCNEGSDIAMAVAYFMFVLTRTGAVNSLAPLSNGLSAPGAETGGLHIPRQLFLHSPHTNRREIQ